MANCSKCAAELLGAAKFCASCGAPVEASRAEPAPAPAAPAAPPPAANPIAESSGSFVGGYVSPSQVNPFAATASPSSGGVRGSSPGNLSPASSSNLLAVPAVDATVPAGSGASPMASDASSASAPPSRGLSGEPSQVSPLAVSNAVSQRGAFQQAIAEAQSAAEREKQAAAPPRRAPGTQMMVSSPSKPFSPQPPPAKPAESAPPPKKAPPKTVAMGFNPAAFMKGGAPAPGSVAPSALQNPGHAPQSVIGPAQPQSGAASAQPQPQPQSVATAWPADKASGVHPHGQMPQSVGPGLQHAPNPAHPPAAVQQPPMMSPQHGFPGSAYGAPPPPQPQPLQQPPQAHYAPPQPQPPPHPQQGQPPAGPGGWGWNQPQPPPQAGPAYGYGFGYPPGARVHVTWSNGQRYPATVSQVSGSQCLVVFPDGQQHWVEMQYLTPG